jgi:hypothetical protein
MRATTCVDKVASGVYNPRQLTAETARACHIFIDNLPATNDLD